MTSELHRLQEALAGNYTVEREIGRGGSSTVYLARDNRHQRNVAIKVLSPDLASSISGDRFRSEIEVAASLAHPNIVPVFDSGRSNDSLFFVMPLVEGETLRARLRRVTRLSTAEALRVTRDVGEALAYAHARGIVHRDVKPENILLIGEHAVVADFGIARALHQAGAERLTLTGQAVGTPIYMSPEQSSGSGDVDHRTDIYALACVVYEMIGGVPPISGDTPQQVLARKLTTTPPSIRSTGVDVSPSMDAALGRALSLNAEARFATVDDFIAALSKGDDRRASRRWARPAALALGTVGVAALGVTLLMSRSPRGSDGGIGLAVFPFRPTVAEATQWSEAIPDLLATQLEGTPGIRVIDPWSLWRSLRAQRGQMARSPDPDEGQRIARTAGAGNFVVGSVAQLRDRLIVSVRLYAVGADRPSYTFELGGPTDSLADVVQRASIEVIKHLAIDPAASSSMRIDRALTSSPMALKDWLTARERLRRGQIDSADAAIARSLAHDSMFVLAIVDAITIKSWVQFVSGREYGVETELAERAVSLSDSLPPRARLRAEAMLASIDTRGSDAARALEGILSVDSLDFDAWRSLDYVTRAYGWQYGKTDRDMREVAERSFRLDTLAVDRLMSRAMLAVALEDSNDIVTQLRRFGAVDASEAPVRGMQRGIEAIHADENRFRELVSENVAAPLPQWIGMVRVLRQSRPDRALVLASATLHSAAAVSKRVPLGALVQLLAANSRWRAVDSLRTSSAFASVQGYDRVVDQVAIAAAIAGTLTDSAAARSVAILARDVPPDSALALFNKQNVWYDGWLIGAFSAMYGDTALARRWHRAMATMPKGVRPREYAVAIQEDIEARLAGRRGDRSTALAHARVAYDRWDIHTENQFAHLPEPAMRFNLALLLRAAGLADSAAALFRSFVPPTTWMGFYTARAALELAEIEEAAKQSDDALRHYFMAARLWDASDPDVAALRARAQRGIARLRSG